MTSFSLSPQKKSELLSSVSSTFHLLYHHIYPPPFWLPALWLQPQHPLINIIIVSLNMSTLSVRPIWLHLWCPHSRSHHPCCSQTEPEHLELWNRLYPIGNVSKPYITALTTESFLLLHFYHTWFFSSPNQTCLHMLLHLFSTFSFVLDQSP